VVNPETIIESYGADALRLYLMFLGPLEAMKPWNTKGIEGIARFLRRVWSLATDESRISVRNEDDKKLRVLHQTIKKVTQDYTILSFNTAIAQMMICVKELSQGESVAKHSVETLVKLVAPLAPHISEELWQSLGHNGSIAEAGWPEHDERQLVVNSVKIIFQVNGKYRGDAQMAADASKDTAITAAKSNERVQSFIEGKEIKKEIYVPGKIVNIVAI
jgi:leucyl-tRNA synthetase